MISALLSENAYLKGQLQRYVLENQQLLAKLNQESPETNHLPENDNAPNRDQ